MIVKKYIANNMNEAVNRIRYELGPEAIIISQRKIRKAGIIGLFSPKVFEVTAAVDNKSSSRTNNMKNSLDAIKTVIRDKMPQNNSINDNNSNKEELLSEIHQMKEMITKISNVPLYADRYNDMDNKIIQKLRESDINERVIKKILAKIYAMDDSLGEEQKIREAIKDFINISDSKIEGTVVLVGPTGVGKTTTIAKIAGRLALMEKKKVGLITIDTYRIGAIEQLSTYANIIGVPFKTVYSMNEMESAINSMKECDVILIDTTGRSSKNIMQIAELNSFVQRAKAENIHIVISSTTKNKDIESILDGYKIFNYNSVIITKLDETTSYGSILNILDVAGKPLSFVTTGQNVPDDFKRLSADDICKLILGEDSLC